MFLETQICSLIFPLLWSDMSCSLRLEVMACDVSLLLATLQFPFGLWLALADGVRLWPLPQ